MAFLERPSTKIDTLILAAHDLTNNGHDTFSDVELTVTAWQLNRSLFGLKGFEDKHPDYKNVSCELIMTRKTSVLREGFIERVGPRTYKITAKGAEAADRLLQGKGRYDKEIAHAET